VILTGTTHPLRRELFAQGVKPPLVRYERRIEDAVRRTRARIRSMAADSPSP
jgi:SulP family sulfate permease